MLDALDRAMMKKVPGVPSRLLEDAKSSLSASERTLSLLCEQEDRRVGFTSLAKQIAEKLSECSSWRVAIEILGRRV